MRLGMAEAGAPPDFKILEDVYGRLEKKVPSENQQAFRTEIKSAVERAIYWEFADKDTVNWSAARPKIESLVKILQRFNNDVEPFVISRTKAKVAARKIIMSDGEMLGQLTGRSPLRSVFFFTKHYEAATARALTQSTRITAARSKQEAIWDELRSELETFLKILNKFNKNIKPFAMARAGGAEAAARDIVIISGRGLGQLSARSKLKSVYDITCAYENSAAKIFKKYIERSTGREKDQVMHDLVSNVCGVLEDFRINESIWTDRKHDELRSDFWETIIEIAAQVRGTAFGGRNSKQSALQFIKRQLRKRRLKTCAPGT